MSVELIHPAFAAPDALAVWYGRIRRPPRQGEDVLAPATQAWLRRLPARQRPMALCLRYARVANRLAWVWADAALAAQAFDDLMNDRRGGRRGFPPLVQAELRRLRDFREAQPMALRAHVIAA